VSQVRFGSFLQLAQRHGGDLLGRVLAPIDLDFDVIARSTNDLVGDHFLFGLDFVVTPSHEPLDRIDSALGVGHCLTTSRLADQSLLFIGECNHARGQPIPFGVREDFAVGPFHDCYHGIGGTEVDPDDFFALSHLGTLLSLCRKAGISSTPSPIIGQKGGPGGFLVLSKRVRWLSRRAKSVPSPGKNVAIFSN
jgi:hypothetical protein